MSYLVQEISRFVAGVRPAIATVDQHVAFVVALSLLAAWPFLLYPSLPRETDAELHVFRTAELGEAIRAGELYPRWAANFYYGYGYPIFNYYAPLTYYLANLFSLALPGGAVFGVKVVFICGFLAAGIGTYFYVEQISGKSAGLISASAYLFTPYVYLIDPHLRGVLAEFFAMCLAPLALAFLEDFNRTYRPTSLVWSSILVAGVIMSHNLLGFVFLALLCTYAVWSALAQHKAKSILWSLAPIVGGVALSGLFLVPLVLESSAVRLSNLIGPGHFDFRNHFLTLGELLSPSLPLDLGAVNPAFRFNLGLGQWVLAAAGLICTAMSRFVLSNKSVKKQGRFGLVGFWSLVTICTIVLMTGASLIVWEAIPQMAYFQFPWRLLALTALSVAVLAGHSAEALEYLPLPKRHVLVAVPVLVPLLTSLPTFVVPQWGTFGPTNRLAILDFELNGLALGTTSTGDYVPQSVDVVPLPNENVIASFREGGPIDRVNRVAVPENASVSLVSHRPTSDVFVIESDEEFVLRLYRFMFPGWKATIDGRPVPIEIAKPEGFITVRVPEGIHEVKVWLGLTGPRIAGTLTTVLGIVAIWALAIILPPRVGASDQVPCQIQMPFPRGLYATVAAFVVMAVTGNAFSLFQPYSRESVPEPAETTLLQYLEGGINLIGYDVPLTEVSSGDTLPLTLYWKAREPITGNYQVFVHLVTSPELIWAQSDKLNPGDYPTTRWRLDKYVRDPHRLVIPPGTPPGDYRIVVGLWNHNTGVRQLHLLSDGTILGDAIVLAPEIRILPSVETVEQPDLPDNKLLNVEIAEGVTLVGASITPSPFTLEQGYLTIETYWQSQEDGLTDYTMQFFVTSADDEETVWQAVIPPEKQEHPLKAWRKGEIVRDLVAFWVGEELPVGKYTVNLVLTMANDPALNESYQIGSFERRRD